MYRETDDRDGWMYGRDAERVPCPCLSLFWFGLTWFLVVSSLELGFPFLPMFFT